MKKLGKLKLHNATLLNDREMKNIVGGYGDGYDEYGSSEEKKCKFTCPGCEETEIPCYGTCESLDNGQKGVQCKENGNIKGKITCYNYG